MGRGPQHPTRRDREPIHCKIGRSDFQVRHRQEAARSSGSGPQAITDAGTETAGTSASLFGGGFRYPDRGQLRHGAARIEAWDSLETAIDDHADPFDREAGFRDGRGQHHFALARRYRRDGAILRVRT